MAKNFNVGRTEPSAPDAPRSDSPPASVGRIVHFVLDEGPCAGQDRAALVVNVAGRQATLMVFTDSPANKQDGDYLPQMMRRVAVAYSETPTGGTWHWPQRS